MQEKTANFIKKCRFDLLGSDFSNKNRLLLYFLTGDGVDLVANLYEKLSGADKFADSRRDLAVFDICTTGAVGEVLVEYHR